MDLLETSACRLKFEAYINDLVSVIGHADRVVALHDYCTGLLLPGERKSVEPMAALTAPARQQHDESGYECVGVSVTVKF